MLLLYFMCTNLYINNMQELGKNNAPPISAIKFGSVSPTGKGSQSFTLILPAGGIKGLKKLLPSNSIIIIIIIIMSDNIMATRGNVRDAPAPITFRVGDSFTTFLELEEKVKSYVESNSVQLWEREARTVTSARKRVDRYLKSDLKYYQLKYCCIHGAKAFKTDGKGIRQNTM